MTIPRTSLLRATGMAMVAVLLLCHTAHSQEATATFTRRPTPVPTAATRSPTIAPTTTPTLGPDDELFVCSLGANDGQLCANDDDCPGGACVLTLGVCDNASTVTQCDTDSDCSGASCQFSGKICLSGDHEGFPCLRNEQCDIGVICASTGLFCDGGDFDLNSCISDDDCTPAGQGFCISPDVLQCTGGPFDGQGCTITGDCLGGACIIAQKLCEGGSDYSDVCQADVQCTDGSACVATQKVCSSGEGSGYGCLRDDQCPGSTCVSTGEFCNGGAFDSFACANQTDCELTGNEPGVCEAPVAESQLCSAGSNDNQACQSNADCPQGACVLTQGVCDAGTNNGDPCEGNADCPSATCVPSRKICDSGANIAFSCLNDAQCGSGSHCITSGLVCVGGPFSQFSCLDDVDCFSSGEEPGACEGVSPRLCTLDAPCELEGAATGEVFGSMNAPAPPASVDFYQAAIPAGAVGVVAVLDQVGGDADLYLGRNPSLSLADYVESSTNAGEASEEVRLDTHTTPTFSDAFNGSATVTFAVVGFDDHSVYVLTALFLANTAPGDANCDAAVDDLDVLGFETVIFDHAAAFSSCAPYGRGSGADANGDSLENAADLIAMLRLVAQ